MSNGTCFQQFMTHNCIAYILYLYIKYYLIIIIIMMYIFSHTPLIKHFFVSLVFLRVAPFPLLWICPKLNSHFVIILSRTLTRTTFMIFDKNDDFVFIIIVIITKTTMCNYIGIMCRNL